MVQHNMMGQDNMILSFPVFTSKLQKKKKKTPQSSFLFCSLLEKKMRRLSSIWLCIHTHTHINTELTQFYKCVIKLVS